MATSLHAGDTNLDFIGVTLLNQVDPTLQGASIPVAQPEAAETVGSNDFEVNPMVVGQPTSLFTWISTSGTATMFPNSVGSESIHGNSVGILFYSPSSGVAPQVSHVDNYDADFFINNFIANDLSIPARVVNQSFTDDVNDPSLDQAYDTYAADNNVLFLSGLATNSGPILSPASCYNSIAVDVTVSNRTLVTGPTSDGRCKPDITAPGSGATSFSTPYVAGAAAVLLQAAVRGDGGSDAAQDIRTLKALLLNGAVKPSGWTNSVTTPMDLRFGAGILNLFNSWEQMKGGKTPFIESTSVTNGAPHPPGSNPNNELVLRGWDFNSLTNSDTSHQKINHYYFNFAGSSPYTLTTTLVWLRQAGKTSINNLNLFLYNAANSNLVLCSTSAVDNVQHIYIPSLPPGRYDLQVMKNPNSEVSANETYALAFEFFQLSLAITQVDTNAVISWPLVPAGFQLQSTTNLNPPTVWSAVAAPVTVNTNTSQNVVTNPIDGGNQFFRLQRPSS